MLWNGKGLACETTYVGGVKVHENDFSYCRVRHSFMRLLDSWHAHTMDTVLPRIHSSNSVYERRGEGEGGGGGGEEGAKRRGVEQECKKEEKKGREGGTGRRKGKEEGKAQRADKEGGGREDKAV